jgi:putative oxygen-independent coproporphyrinogen III oxidase
VIGIGLYVHFPWCVRKCPYCDFNSHPVRGTLDEGAYLEALLLDASQALAAVPPGGVSTVFFGGGTPSLFSPIAFRRLLAALSPWLAVDAEVTMEANPGTTEYHDPADYLAAGINRLSLGAQSFDDRQLARLGRIHHAEETRTAFRRARAAGFTRINLDLMYALPRQTVAESLADLDAALALEPDHVSWYQLTLEPKTEFAGRPPKLPGDSAVARMEAAGHARLAAAGQARYEISAYARPDQRCRHNVNYWSFGDYVGLGAGAHGKRTRPGSRGARRAADREGRPAAPLPRGPTRHGDARSAGAADRLRVRDERVAADGRGFVGDVHGSNGARARGARTGLVGGRRPGTARTRSHRGNPVGLAPSRRRPAGLSRLNCRPGRSEATAA